MIYTGKYCIYKFGPNLALVSNQCKTLKQTLEINHSVHLQLEENNVELL